MFLLNTLSSGQQKKKLVKKFDQFDDASSFIIRHLRFYIRHPVPIEVFSSANSAPRIRDTPAKCTRGQAPGAGL